MFAEETVKTTLGAVSAITTLVGAALGPKGGLPKDSPSAPAISFERISTLPSDDLNGGGALDQVRMQVDCWGATALQAMQLAALARDAISPATSVGVGIFEDRSGPTLDIETRVWGVRQDFFIWEERI